MPRSDTPARRRPRRLVLATVGPLGLIAPIALAVGAAHAATAPPAVESTHAATVAQGVIQVGTGDHQWMLQAYGGVSAPVEVPAAGPTFVTTSSALVRVLDAGGAGLGTAVEAGEAMYVPAGHGHQLSAPTPADVLEIGVAGGQGLGTFPLTEGLHDLELIRDVLAPGEALTVAGIEAGLVLVGVGSVTLPDGSALGAGYHLPVAGTTSLTNRGDASAVVLVATVSPVAAPATAGATPSTTPAGSTPDGSTPSNSTPGGSTPGGSTPGGSTPGGSTPGGSTPSSSPPSSSAPGGSTPGNGGSTPTTVGGTTDTSAPATTPPTTAAPATTAAPPTTQAGEGPLSLQLVSCSGGGTLNIRVDASAGSGYRRNVQSVTVSRQNNEGAYTSPWNLQWIGEDTAEHDEWSTQGQVTGQNQNMGDGLRITARSVGGQSQTINTTLSSSC